MQQKLEWLNISELQDLMTSGELSSTELVQHCLTRISTFDRQGPSLNSVLELNPEALLIAGALDRERQLQGPRSKLHGIPVLVKDNINTGDMMHTSGGSLALANSYASEDAHIVTLLRQAGAVILGKANMTEWANFMTNGMPGGYSSRGGQVRNPYSPGQFGVGGSSSGSGVAVAAGLVPIAVGTETSGSILSPATSNSVVGIKPTVGLVSRTGIIPISFSQDTAGPLAKTVTDAALLLNALAGGDVRDVATGSAAGHIPEDYCAFLDCEALQGARLGILQTAFERIDEDRKAVYHQAFEACRQAGATVIEGLELPSKETKLDATVLVYEFKPALNNYLRSVTAENAAHSLADVIAYNMSNPHATLKYGQVLLLESEATSGTLCEPEYIEARQRDLWATTTAGIDQLIKEHQLTALLMPGNYGAGYPARAGYPSVCVPAGYTEKGQPCGLTFTATAYQEGLLIGLAYSYEQATKARVLPILE